ncbi:MAG: FHA domain-containing protein [Deltaproteobacteria bacterium]|nr:FHA domain-containing protein [Deltaproteobacteria bacterium]
MRYRLRFLLQEFDLVGPEIVIGRSPECQVTIEDPLISRQHAKLSVSPTGVIVTDLGSRNGSRINGRVIREPVRLKDGDRIRVGTQELVFNELRDAVVRAPRETGALRQCPTCHVAFPEGSPVCPHCGAAVKADEDTMSGLFIEPRRSFTFALLGDVVERALATGRVAEAERVLRRAQTEVDDSLRAGEKLDAAQLSGIAVYVVRVAALARDIEWLAWLADVHRRLGVAPDGAVLDRLDTWHRDTLPGAGTVVRRLADHTATVVDGGADAPAVARLRALAARLGG